MPLLPKISGRAGTTPARAVRKERAIRGVPVDVRALRTARTRRLPRVARCRRRREGRRWRPRPGRRRGRTRSPERGRPRCGRARRGGTGRDAGVSLVRPRAAAAPTTASPASRPGDSTALPVRPRRSHGLRMARPVLRARTIEERGYRSPGATPACHERRAGEARPSRAWARAARVEEVASSEPIAGQPHAVTCVHGRRLRPTVDACDAVRLAGEQLGGEVAERADHLRSDELDLGEQVPLARLDLVGQGIAVPGWAALEHVCDVDVRAPSPIVWSRRSSTFPAWPTNGAPCLSSWNPGASPTNMRSASEWPVRRRPGCGRRRVRTWYSLATRPPIARALPRVRVHRSRIAFWQAARTTPVQWPQPQLPPQQLPPPPPPTVAPTGRGVANDDRSFVTVPLPHAGQWTVPALDADTSSSNVSEQSSPRSSWMGMGPV